MIMGIGNDVVDIARIRSAIERHPRAFVDRVFTPREIELAGMRRKREVFFAGRWAAKEAVAKALGTGIGGQCNWLDIEVTPDERARPVVTLHGRGAATAAALGVHRIHVSISHEISIATAVAVAES